MITGEDYLIEFNVENSEGINYDLNIFTNVKATLIEKKSGVKLQYYSYLNEVNKLPIFKDILTFRLYIEKAILLNRVNGNYYLEVEFYLDNLEVSGGVQIIKENFKLNKLITNEL